jgi:CubicO group peptidase (beta-lactamase class C family)
MTPAEFVEYFKTISKPHFDRHYRYGYEWIAKADKGAIISWMQLSKEEIEKIDRMTPAEFVEYFKTIHKPHFDRHYRYGYEWIAKADKGAIISWLRQGTWNEWAAAAVVAKLVKEYAEYVDPEFYPLFARQVADEARHWC